jgi:2-methylisocitrate lyase-like PEP mutase family enzyme
VQSTHLPVVADLENGFGDPPEFIAETIRLAAAAGPVGGSIKDSTGDEENPIYEFDFAVARVTAAVGAVRALDFPSTLAARAENFLHGRADLDDTIHRLKAFEKTRTDVLFAPGLPNFDAIRMVCASLSRPVNVIANGALGPRCFIPSFDGAIFSLDWRDALWDKFFTAVPRRLRQSVEQYKIVKRA